jgi:hypothetical protein
MSSYVLYTLRDLRIDGERQAERALAVAAASRRRADEETARLESRVAEAQAARRAAREKLDAEVVGSAADAQARLRFWSRLDAEARACTLAVASHRKTAVEPAVRTEAEARAGHLRARQRREVVDKAIARREAAGRLDQSRRAEAAADDLTQRRRRSD